MARFNFSKGETEYVIYVDLRKFLEKHIPCYTKETLHVDRVINIIDESCPEYICLDKLAIKIERGEKTVMRIIKKAFGIKYKQLIVAFRIYCALRLLYKAELDITYVSISLSYSDVSSMDRDFQKVLGVPPIKAIEELKDSDPDIIFNKYYRFKN